MLTFTLIKLGVIWFLVATSTCSGLLTTTAMKIQPPYQKLFGANCEKEIHATIVDVSSSRLNIELHLNVFIENDYFFYVI